MTKSLVASAVLSVALIWTLSVNAQTAPLAPGTVSGVMLFNNGAGSGVCPSDFWTPPTGTIRPTCYTAKMDCASSSTVPTLNFIYSYITPASPLGTVVIFSGAPGTLGTLGEHNQFAQAYFGAGYEVVGSRGRRIGNRPRMRSGY